MSLTGIVGDFRVLPWRWLESFWREGGYVRRPGLPRLASVVVGALFGHLATWMAVSLIQAGGIATVLGVVELAVAALWLGVLLLGTRGPRLD
jgi:hypothetical protein